MESSGSEGNHGKGLKSGQLWSNVLIDETIDLMNNDIFKTKLDARKSNGLEERGNEQYLSQLVSRKAKNFVAPRVQKAKVANLRGHFRFKYTLPRGRGRGGPGRRGNCTVGMTRGRGLGRGKYRPRDEQVIPSTNPGESPAAIIYDAPSLPVIGGDVVPTIPVDEIVKSMKVVKPPEEPTKPKTAEEIKEEEMKNLKAIFGGGHRRRAGTGAGAFSNRKPSVATATFSSSNGDDAMMDIDGEMPRPTLQQPQLQQQRFENGGGRSREIIDYGDVDYSF
ncbi:uncharacterized protein LOC110848739 [Folsomia candida]|uniref:Complexin-3 n=1 Tax=Folsomia candida TaxID=158441 RepID=A0A226EFH0_FOLCA|nr:uncharacterized protein LOC110848739 [Folsomia candida]OXA56149.1 Complexin-3 [Folsomia candida]